MRAYYAIQRYNREIVDMSYSECVKDKITLEDIPKKFNERDLPTILNDLNALTGLSNIKIQIKDFASLLKFNKKAQVNIENFNLHMIFTGNSGTGTALYGSKCSTTLLKLIIIFAGYKEEMEKSIKTNPGLASRIGYKIDFPDYSLDELTNIFLKLVKRNNLEISDEALEKIKIIIRDSSKIENFGNARYINSLYQKLLIEHAKNEEINYYKEDMYRIKKVDAQYEKLIADNLEKKIGF